MPQPEAVNTSMAEAGAAGAQACVVRGSPFFSSVQRAMIVDSVAKHRLPAIYERRDDVERGGLMSYAPDIQDQYRATAEYVVRVLAGEKPGDLPIQQPTKFALVINLNDQSGIKRRKINLISVDDGYLTWRTANEIRKLIEVERVAFIFGSIGTPTQVA